MVTFSRRATVALAAVVLAIVFASSAVAAYNYVYWNNSSTPSGTGGGDTTNYYRNYNDSCSGDGYAWTKSIYGLSDGSWVASIESWNACGFSKAHLGPSSNYGYTYVQSKCRNTYPSSIWLRCETTRP